MANGKRDRDPRDVQPQLQEVEPERPAVLPPRPQSRRSSIERMMEQVTEEFRSLPVAAQRSVLRLVVPEIFSELDARDRPVWAEELVGPSPETSIE